MSTVSFSRSLARQILSFCAALIVTTAAGFAQTPSAADGFDPNVNGNVYALATQADGKILVAGQFTLLQPNGALSPTARNNFARLNSDGTVDAAFDPNVNGAVRAIALQADGKILIGGDFTTVQPAGTTPAAPRNRIARLNADGSLDTSFSPGVSGGVLPQVYALALDANGGIVVGGNFAAAQSSGVTDPKDFINRRNLARFSATGALDNAYNPSPDGIVLALAAHTSGRVIVGGGFTQITGVTRNRLARLNANGTLDTGFDPNANNGVAALAVQRDGKIIASGFFTTLQPAGTDTAVAHNYVVRLNTDGSLDNSFYPNAGGHVTSLSVLPDGGFVMGGRFQSVWGRGTTVFRTSYAARFTADGSVDSSFDPGMNAEVAALAPQSDGKIVLGGYFTSATRLGASSATPRNRLARINANGTLDTNFELSAGGRPVVSLIQTDGKIVVGGTFTSIGGATHNFLTRLNADGSVDATYTPDLNGRVLALAYESSSNKVIVGGAFTTVNGQTRNHIARLNANGTLDTDFNPNLDAQVNALAVQSDGKIVVGGLFGTAQPPGATEFTLQPYLLRLTSAGLLDTTFTVRPDSTVNVIVIQSDGKILIGGSFTGIAPNGTSGGTNRNRLARLNADGTLDSFNPNFNAQVNAIAVQSDGKVIAGGAFTALAPNNINANAVVRNRLVRLNADGTVDTAFDPNANAVVNAVALQSDGKIIVGGGFIALQPAGDAIFTLRKYLARLTSDGKVDATFNFDLSEQPGNRIDSIVVAPDGRILIAGSFTSLQPAAERVARRGFARLNANGTLDTAFDPGATGSTSAQINGIALQADGKAVVVGAFADVGGAKSANIARFLPEGAADSTFNPSLGTDGAVNAVVIRPNGQAVASQLAGFAWLNRDGSLRTSFAPGTNVRLGGRVSAVAVQTDGSVLLGGAFTNLTNASTGNLLRFTAAGALDPNFNPNVNGEVAAIALQADGRIIVTGSFTSIGGVARNRIARLNADGTVDSSYDPNLNASGLALLVQTDGKVVVGGGFTSVTPNGATSFTARNYLARLNTDGTVDTGYNPSPGAPVRALALQADGKVVAGGDFTTVQPNSATTTTDRRYLARFNTDGALDTGFNPNPNGSVFALAVQSNGALLIGGEFTAFQPNGGASVSLANLARVGTDGALETAFNPNPNGAVRAIAVQSDGALVIAGNFKTLQPTGSTFPVARSGLARVTTTGAVDFSFNPDPAGTVSSLATRPDGSVLVTGDFGGLQPNGLILVGGVFGTISDVPARNLALISDTGAVNASFQPAPNAAVNAILSLADGRFIVGGAFTTIAGATRNRLARFNADGSFDATFNASADGIVRALALQSDGKILVGGDLTAAGHLVRLNADGTADTSFTAGFDVGSVRGIAVQADGRILVHSTNQLARLSSTGANDTSFTRFFPGEGLRAITLQSDGRIIVAGSFLGSIAASQLPGSPFIPARLVRLESNGAIDGTFNPAPNGAVTALALQTDGRLMIGGSFTVVSNLQRIALARLASTGSATQTLGATADRTTLVWTRAGTAAELSAVTFERSTDNRTWTLIGSGTRVGSSSSWQLTGQQLPASGSFFVRVRGIAPSSAGTSSSVYESTREFDFANPVFLQSPDAGQTGTDTFTIDALTGTVLGVPPSAAGVYLNATNTAAAPVIRGVSSEQKILGAAEEVGTDIRHPNTNVYDQVLLEGAATTVTADAGQIVRLSFLSMNNDIVQVEFSGAGSLTVVLEAFTGPIAAENYNQPGVTYMKGHAGLIVVGANETTNLSVFSVGTVTAIDQSLFRANAPYTGVADIAYVAISSATGKFGGLRTANVNYLATHGLTGVYAPGVQFTGPVYVGDIIGYDAAVAMLNIGSSSDVRIAGGDLFQPNGHALNIGGVGQLQFVDGYTSQGTTLPAQTNRAVLEAVAAPTP